MTTQTTTINNGDSSPAVDNSATTSPSNNVLAQGPITIARLMALLSAAQTNFGNLEEILALSNCAKVKDPNTGAVTYTSFSQIQGQQVIDAAIKATNKLLKDIAAAERANKRHGIFGKIMAALSIVVAVTVVVATGGAASALLPLAVTAVVTGMSLADKKDPFQMATQELVKALPKFPGSEFVATCLVSLAVAGLTGGVAGFAGAGQTVALSMSAQMGTQMLIETGLPAEAASGVAALADACGKPLSDNAKLIVQISVTCMLLAASLYAGYKGTASALDNPAGPMKSILESPKIVGLIKTIQFCAQGMTAICGAANGVVLVELANATYDENKDRADLAKYYGSLGMINNAGQMQQDSISSILGEINDELAAISESAGKDLEKLAELAG